MVPAYNAAPSLSACLDSLLKQTLAEPYAVVVVDDGSSDSTSKIAASYAPRVKLLQHAHRLGAAAARNTGIRHANGEIVLFTDADCEPVPGWASALATAIRAGADGAKGTYLSRQSSMVARFVQAEYESKYGPMLRLPQIDFVDTYSAGYRRQLLVEAGGFDPGISAVEDQELSFRIAQRGYKLRFVPEAAVYHTHAATAPAYMRKKFWIGYWKVRVAALHPRHIVRDSHTPQSLKLQMALATLTACLLPAGLFVRPARQAAGVCSLAFFATTLPFALRVTRHDPILAAASPALLALRALALSAGFIAGLLQYRANMDGEQE